MVILIFGLSGSGKTTIGKNLLFEIANSLILDGDDIRKGINKDLGLSIDDRKENIRRIAEMAKLLNEQGRNVIISAICPTNEIRNNVKEIVGKDNLITIYLSTSLDVCKKRDVKGLYAKYGDEMTGIKSVFEEPESYDLKLDTSIKNVNECVNEICDLVEQFKYPKSSIKKRG